MTQSSSEVTIDLNAALRFILHGAVWALLIGAIVGGGAYYLALRQPPVFRADATILVARSTAGFTQFGLSPVTAPPIDLSAYRAAASSDRVLADTAERLGTADVQVGTIRSLRGATNTYVSGDGRDSSLLGIEARASTPQVAIDRANAHAASLVEWDRRRATDSLTRVINTLEQQIDALGEQIRAVQTAGGEATQGQVDGLIRLRADQQQQLAYARALVASAEGSLSVMQSADTSARQTAPRPVMNAFVAALIAIAGTYGFLLVRAALSTRLRSVDDIGAASGLPLLAQLPSATGKEGWRMQEAINYLRTNLMFTLHDVHPKVLLVTSAGPGEGKTTVACELASALARNGYRTLLVDADLRSPSIFERFDIVGTHASVTTTREWLDPAKNGRNVLRVTLDDASLFVVPQFVSTGDAAEALSRGFTSALEQWGQYDAVIIDSAPLLSVADALAIAPSVSGTLLVVDAQRTHPSAIARARELLDRGGANVLGVVANRVRNVSGAGGYGRYGAYGGAASSGYGTQPVPASRGIARPHADSATGARTATLGNDLGGPR